MILLRKNDVLTILWTGNLLGVIGLTLSVVAVGLHNELLLTFASTTFSFGSGVALASWKILEACRNVSPFKELPSAPEHFYPSPTSRNVRR
jgi:hypothetical protein